MIRILPQFLEDNAHSMLLNGKLPLPMQCFENFRDLFGNAKQQIRCMQK